MKQKLESERLYLYPVSDEEMRVLIGQEPDPGMQQAYSEMLKGCLDDPENRMWYAIWHLELKSRPGSVVRDLCFKGPASDGIIEIGYGLRDGCCGRGYMTEVVKTVSEWALTRNGVSQVEAETEPENAASQKVLLRAGFTPAGVFGEEGPRFVYRSMPDAFRG